MSDIAAIRERWSNATIGPWEWDTNAYEWQRYRLWRPIGCHEVIVVTYDGQGNESMNVSNADAIAIAAAPTDIATLLAEVDRLRDVAAGPYLILDEREGIIGIVNATDYDEAWATFQAKNPGNYDGEPDDNEVVIEAVTLEWCDKVVDGLSDAREEIRRLTAALAAAQAARDALRERAAHAEATLSGLLPGPVSDVLIDARNHESRTEGVSPAADWGRTVGRAQVVAAAQPVVEWRDRGYYEGAKAGRFLLFVHSRGWEIRVEDVFGQQHSIVTGPETGPAGKAACIRAYYRAVGIPCP